MLPVHVRSKVIVIALAVIVLACLKKIDDLARLPTCRCGTPAMVSSSTNSLDADENTLVGLIKACIILSPWECIDYT